MTTPLPSLLDALFPRGHSIIVADSVLTGTATTDDGEVTVIGTTDKIEVGVDHALVLAETVLASTASNPQRPIVMLVGSHASPPVVPSGVVVPSPSCVCR